MSKRIDHCKLILFFLSIILSGAILSSHLSANALPQIKDPKLKVESWVEGLTNPVDIAFLGKDDILIALKNTGVIVRAINGTVLPETLVDFSVANGNERGLLGIAISKNESKTYLFTYHTQSRGGEDGDDIEKNLLPVGSFLMRFELVANKLVNPKLLAYINTTSMRPTEDPYDIAHHVGGKIVIGPDKNVYVLIGDGYDHRTQAQNFLSGPPPDGTGGILRITQDGKPALNPPLGDSFPLNMYYAYGIRNGFGMDFDPRTKYLWDAEAGSFSWDEINLVPPGFNSGWRSNSGIANASSITNTLVDFDGLGQYRDPELTWKMPVTPVAIKFLNSSVLGPEYKDHLFVSRYLLGHNNKAVLYQFNLNSERNQVLIGGDQGDKTVDNFEEDENNVLISGLGVITDIEEGPEGYLYLVQLTRPGTIYRISPVDGTESAEKYASRVLYEQK